MGSLPESLNVDALVVGAGLGGIYSTYRLSRAGLNVMCIDIAGDVGGTWYWNRYPGAMSDTESYLYRFSWDAEDLRTYPWTHHYVYQPEILKYLQHVVNKHDLRRHMRFKTEMESAHWDDAAHTWTVNCAGGTIIKARHLVNCLGLLSKPNYPDIDGISSFAGETVHTANWDDKLDLTGKTVGIIGNGSTGVQVMTAIASQVGRLTSFQRHPQYSVPSGQGPVSSSYRKKINKNYDEIWNNVWSSSTAFGVPESTRKTMEATPEERQQAFQEVWDRGNGFRFMFGAFGDITTDLAANEEACNFIRGKIDEIVKDPQKAKALKPTDLYARRPLCDSGYYQIFNRDNVDIVDLRETPIDKIVPEGIKTKDGTVHKLDVLIFATGFDAIEGNYLRINIVGREESIRKHWRNGPTAYGAVACSGFPNMYAVSGPQGAFANFPVVIESEVDFITGCILEAEKSNRLMEVETKAEQQWNQLCDELVEGSLFKTTASWIFGANVDGRKTSTKFYFGGLNRYREWTKKEVEDGFPGFRR
ncbi:Ff.00g099300.m01.CDS01 [Fusarium sp. VM40]|nr:Ff.00g099300.m01.CDS01 [Fusarium sp. VM40]